MTDELEGQSQDDQGNASLDAPEDATQQDSQETSVEDELPERFRGKSPSEIAKSYLELEKKYGEQGGTVGELKNELAYLKSQSQFQQGNQNQQTAPQQQWGQQQSGTDWDDEFLASPSKAIGKVLQEYDKQRRLTESARQFPRALRDAETMEPDIFGDKEIRTQVENFVRDGVRRGTILPKVQTDTDTLIAIGVHMKYQRDKANPPKKAVAPVETESPVQVKKESPVEEPIQWTRDEEDFLDHAIALGIYKDREEAVKEYRKGRKK